MDSERDFMSHPLVIMGQVMDLWSLPADTKATVREKVRMGFNMEHWLSADFSGGPCDGKFLFKTSVGTRRDDLSAYLPIARRAGLRVFVYFNAHWYNEAIGDDMYMRTASGDKVTAYGHGWLTCPTGPFRAWSERVMRDLGEYDIDGVFIDGPAMAQCWCPACRKAFESRFGSEMPADFATAPVRAQLAAQEFLARRRGDYVAAVRRAVTWRKNTIAAYFNGDSEGRSIRMHRLSAASQDLIGAEGGFIGYTPLRGQFRYKTGAMAKVLEAVDPAKPRVVFIDHAFKKYDYYPLTASEARLMYGATIANGAWPWYLVYWFTRRSAAGRAGVEMNRFIADNSAHLALSRPLANVALVQSDATLELMQTSDPAAEDDLHATGARSAAGAKEGAADHHREFLGFYEALTRSQIPFDVLDDGSLASGIDARYELLILGACVAMSDAAAAGVRRFVERGGSVIATWDAGSRTETGERRATPALADVFGLRALGPVYGPTVIDYVRLEPRKFLARGIEAEALPCPKLSRAIDPAPGASVLARYFGRMPGRYCRLPDVLPDAFAVERRVGKGRAIFIAGNLGEHYNAYAFDDHRRMIANAVRACATPAVTVEGAGEFLEVSWRRAANGDHVLHLLNHAGGERPYERVLPLAGLKFRVRVPGKVKSVRAAKSKKRIAFRRRAGEICFALDMAGEYEMIVFTL